MAILPRYKISDQDIPTANMPVAPADNVLGRTLSELGQIGQSLTHAQGQVALRAQHLADTTLMAKKLMEAELDLDTFYADIKGTRTMHAQAPIVMSDAVSKAQNKWMQGLRPEQAAILQRELMPRVIGYQKQARDLQNKYLVDDAKATLLTTEQTIIDNAGRLDQTDEQAFRHLYTSERDANGKVTRTAGIYKAQLDNLVATGLIDKEEAQKRLVYTMNDAAYGRLQRMSVSYNPSIVQRAIDTVKQEESQKGSTFASDIITRHRNELLAHAQGQLVTIANRTRQAELNARQDMEHQLTKDQERTKVMFNQQLDKGELDKGQVSLAADLRLLQPGEQNFYYKAIEERVAAGAPSNPQVLRQLTLEAYNINSNPASVQQRVQQAFTGNQLAYKDMRELMGHLQSWQQHLNDQNRQDNRELTNKRHSEVVGLIHTSMPSSGSGSQQYDALSRQAATMAVEELGRSSNAMVPGGQDAQAIWDANKVRWLSQVPINAQMRAQALRMQLGAQYKDVQLVQDIYTPNYKALPAPERQRIFEQVKEVLDLEKALQGAPKSQGGASTAPQNTKGTPQGSAEDRKTPPPVGKRQ